MPRTVLVESHFVVVEDLIQPICELLKVHVGENVIDAAIFKDVLLYS